MNMLLWTLQILLAVIFAGAGLVKLIKPTADLSKMLGDWVDDIPAPLIKLLGVAEIAAAVGLILPLLVGVAPALTALAAVGVVLVMIGATVVHARRSEYPNVAFTLVITAIGAFVAWSRFGPYAF